MTAQRATDLRRQNLVRVLDVILREGAHSRAALAERLGLSRAALTAIVGDLITLGVLREGGSEPSQGGRPLTLLVADPDRYAALGVDVRIDRIQLLAVGLDGAELTRASSSVPAHPTPREITESLGDTFATLRSSLDHELLGYGFAMPARRADLGITHEIWGWERVPMGDAFRRIAGESPYGVLDLAEASCLANSRQPQLSGMSRMAHLQIGAGATMALAVEGRIDLDLPPRWGDVGHIPLGLNDRRCSCGRDGCSNAYLSIEALSSRVPHVSVEEGPNRISRLAMAIERAARAGDVDARHGIEEVALATSRLVVVLVELNGLQAVTIGGYPLFLGEDYSRLVDQLVEARLGYPSPVRHTGLGDDAALIGASLVGREIGLSDPYRLRRG